jgi:tetratricopeptide (TPR) repeat protein
VLARLGVAALLLGSALAPRPDRGAAADPAAALERAIAAGEKSLRQEQFQAAEGHYRSALLEGWLLMGALERADGRLPQAREAFRRASTSAGDPRRALQALALVHLQMREPEEAVTILERLAGEDPQDVETGRLLARARVARKQPNVAIPVLSPAVGASPLAALAPPRRLALRSRVNEALTSSYLNLGILQAKRERFPQAAELLEKAAELDADSSRVQSSLGVAHFNAGQFDKATAPLSRALAANPQDAPLKRMLAMAWLNTKAYDQAADLLRDDPEVSSNPSLQFAYGLALVKSDRAAEAEGVFSQLLARHGDSAELSVLLGQAYAQQGEFDSARESLRRALELKPDVAEANATLGLMYLRQGRLPEAEEALRAELKEHPDDLPSQQNLAIVLDEEQRAAEAISLLRRVLKSQPQRASARYLLGKILLAQGNATEAVEHLETAAGQAPGDAKIRYQLGQAYQRLGRTEMATQQFELFRQLKAKH